MMQCIEKKKIIIINTRVLTSRMIIKTKQINKLVFNCIIINKQQQTKFAFHKFTNYYHPSYIIINNTNLYTNTRGRNCLYTVLLILLLADGCGQEGTTRWTSRRKSPGSCLGSCLSAPSVHRRGLAHALRIGRVVGPPRRLEHAPLHGLQ